jgi:hypothetical protein
MPQTIETVSPIAELLTNVAQKHINRAFVIEELLPVVPVGSERFTYMVFGREHFKHYNTRRAYNARPIRIDYTLSMREGTCEEFMAEHPIYERMRAEAQRPLDVEIQGTELVTDALRLDQEIMGQSILFNKDNYYSGMAVTPSKKWDETGATIFKDITDRQEAVRKRIGMYPNTILIPPSVAQIMAFSSEVTDYIKNVIGLQRLERPAEEGWMLPPVLFGMRVVMPSVIELSDGTLKDVWGDSVLVAYVAPRPAVFRPSLGYTFRRRGFRIRIWHDDYVKADIIEGSWVQKQYITGVEPDTEKIIAAGLLYDVLS